MGAYLSTSGKHALGCKQVYRIKFDSNGTVEHYNVGLIILRNIQIKGIDYIETFASVAKMITVRILLAVASAKNWEVQCPQRLFAREILHEEVYMKPLLDFCSSSPDIICCLLKSLWPSSSSPLLLKSSTALKNSDFQQSLADYSLLVYYKNGVYLSILIYVEDLIITFNNLTTIAIFKKHLGTFFYMKDLGFLKYFLGI